MNMNPSVSSIINTQHLSNNSTLGACPDLEVYGDPLNPSINLSSAYAFKTIDDLGKYHANKFNSLRYTRDSNALVRQIEMYLSAMNHSSNSILVNSGMSAIAICLYSLLSTGKTI